MFKALKMLEKVQLRFHFLQKFASEFHRLSARFQFLLGHSGPDILLETERTLGRFEIEKKIR